jgi:hypothetical protein
MADNGRSQDYLLIRKIEFNTNYSNVNFIINNDLDKQLSDLANNHISMWRIWQEAYRNRDFRLCNSLPLDNYIYRMNQLRLKHWYWKPLQIHKHELINKHLKK